MFSSIIAFILFCIFATASAKNLNIPDYLKCKMFVGVFHNMSLSAYYPKFRSYDKHHQHSDVRGCPLNNLQDYLIPRPIHRYVTVAGNIKSGIIYGTKICIEELNMQYGMQVALEIRDQIDVGNKSVPYYHYSRLEICVKTEEDTHAPYLNRIVTLYI